MFGVGGEPVPIEESSSQVVEVGVGELHGRTAAPADGVMVGVPGEVVGDGLVAEAGRPEDARLPQRLDGAIHGRQVDGRGATPDPGGEFLDADVVMSGVEQFGEHGPPGGGHPDPASTELVEEGVETAG